jgi:uncharacterized low-complexity protein
MHKFEKVKEYLTNIDFEFVTDHEILDNVYKEIEGYEEKLILNIESVSNFEVLIKKSNLLQIINLCKKINLHFLSLKKTGSKFCEVILESIFDIIYKCVGKKTIDEKCEENKCVGKKTIDDKCEENKCVGKKTIDEKCEENKCVENKYVDKKCEENKYVDKKSLENYILNIFDDNFKELCMDKNGTHVIRKYLRIIYGRDNNFIKYKSCFNLKDYKSVIIDLLDKDISTDTLITIILYLKLNYSKQVSRILVKKYVVEDNLKNKMYSYIFEDLINISEKKTLSMIFDKVKTQFSEYINDQYAVFFILSLIKRYPEENDFYLSYCDKEMKNSNVMLKVLENYCILKNIKKIKKILKEFYDIEDDVFKNILMSHSESPDTKYINLICLLMDLDILRVNEDFIKYFNNDWIHRKYGIKLLKGFLEGGSDNKLKSRFARKINIGGSLNKKKEGKKILNLIKTYKKLKL